MSSPMTSSEQDIRRAIRIIDQTAAMLDEILIQQRIDGPIDRVLQSFCVHDRPARNHEELHATVTRFVIRLYAEAMPIRREMSDSQARDEAIEILEHAYEGTHANGYHAALVDATDPAQAGLPLVIARVAEGLKAQQRQSYLRSVAVRQIESVDWHTRSIMAGVLIERYAERLPLELRQFDPDQLADHVFALLKIALDIEGQIEKLESHPFR